MRTNLIRLLLAVALVVSCEDGTVLSPSDDSGGTLPGWEAGGGFGDGPGACTPGGDADGDKISDDREGCTRDTDGDQIPDYKDTDSDNDGVLDGDEDRNGDGLVGCCLSTCNEKRKGCTNNKDGCGSGQKCSSGKCSPAVSFLCANGESDPRKKATFPGGASDKQLPTFVCHPSSETTGKGLKQMQFKSSSAGDWKVALEKGAVYGELTISGAAAKEAAASFDLTAPQRAVAGFVISLAGSGAKIDQEAATLIGKAQAMTGAASVSQLSSGSAKSSHDSFPSVVSTQLAITLSAAASASTVRNNLVAALVGKKITKLPTATVGTAAKGHALRFSSLLRKDGRLLVMGGVAEATIAADTKKETGIILDDLSNGTGLATASDAPTVECDPFVLSKTPKADIIWVVDDSASMKNNQKDVAANAKDFFSRALKAGLDFRVGVTGVHKKTNGHFCSRISTKVSDSGGVDRFLLPTEQKIFEACILNPAGASGTPYEYGLKSGYDAVTSHLPRAANDPTKIRTDAALVVIQVTDEAAQSLKSKKTGIPYTKTKCTLTATHKTKLSTFMKPHIDLFTGKNSTYGTAAKAVVHFIGGLCNNKCNAQLGHAYIGVAGGTGGLTADVCQQNLGATMQIIISAINGYASPIKLEYVPISASLAVAVEKNQISRSRDKGFDYVSGTNTLVFYSTPFKKGDRVVASYRRYLKQNPIK